MAVGLLILPMKRMLLVASSKMKTMKGLLTFMTSGMLMGMISMVVLAAALVPVSSTFRAARWDTCGQKNRSVAVSVCYSKTLYTLSDM